MTVFLYFLSPLLIFMGQWTDGPLTLEQVATSVEIGITEMSPKGLSAGLAVPASGASTPSGLRHSCASDEGSVTLDWNESSATTHLFANHSYEVTYNLCVSTNSSFSSCDVYSASDLTEPPWTGDITSGESYYWRVNACAGGSCGNYKYSSFVCGEPTSSGVNECSDDADNDGDGGIDWDGLNLGFWVKNNGSTCSAACSAAGSTAAANEYGQQCTSGENVIAAPRDQFGVSLYDPYGCWGMSCATGNHSSPTEVDWLNNCYRPDQTTHDNNYTDRTVACYCSGGEAYPPDEQCTSASDNDESSDSTINLEVKNDTTEGSWEDGPLTIENGDEVSLQWTPDGDIELCDGSNFSTGTSSPDSGIQTDVDEPASGSSTTYTVACTAGDGGIRTDSVVVTNSTAAPVTIEANPPFVHRGDDVSLTWNLSGNDPASCTLSGSNNLPVDALTQSQPLVLELAGETTFTLNCGSSSDSVTVRILPTIEET